MVPLALLVIVPVPPSPLTPSFPPLRSKVPIDGGRRIDISAPVVAGAQLQQGAGVDVYAPAANRMPLAVGAGLRHDDRTLDYVQAERAIVYSSAESQRAGTAFVKGTGAHVAGQGEVGAGTQYLD